MINAIGLENPGIHTWIGQLPEWAALQQPVIVSVGGNEPAQYAGVVAALEAHLASALTCAASPDRGLRAQRCPAPMSRSGSQIGADPAATAEVVAACREASGTVPARLVTPKCRDVTGGRGPQHFGRRRRRTLAGSNIFKALRAGSPDPEALPREPDRRPVRPRDQAHRVAHGRLGGAGVPWTRPSSAWAA